MEEKDELLELIQDEEDYEFNKKIEHKMEKKLTRKVIVKIILVFVVVVSAIKGSEYVIQTSHYNPMKEDIEFDTILSAYVATFYPGTNARVNDIKDLDYGNYEVNIWAQDSFEAWKSGGNRQTLEIKQSKIDGLFSAGIYSDNGSFGANHEISYFENDPDYYKKIVQEIDSLPDSAYINASMILKKAKNLDEMADLMNHYSNSRFAWLAMKTPLISNAPWIENDIGINTYQYFGSTEEKYSHFYDGFYFKYADEIKTGEKLRNYYYDVLQVLIDHPRAYEMLNGNNEDRPYEQFVKEVEYIKENEYCAGFLIYTNKQDIIDLLESGMVSYICINDVKVSEYSK